MTTTRGSIYPTPEYIAGITLCELNAEINTFHLSTVQNQFTPSQHIHLNYNPATDEERETISERTRAEYQGAKNSGKIVLSFGSVEEKPIIETIQSNDSDKKFKELTTWMRDGIFSAHQITDQSLLGIETPGRLGGRNNLLEALSVFQAQYVSVKQRFLEKELNLLGRVNGLKDKILIEKYNNNLEPDLPMTDLVLLLTSTFSDKQKVAVLVSKGYSRDKALELIDSGTSTPVAPTISPTASTPPKNNTP